MKIYIGILPAASTPCAANEAACLEHNMNRQEYLEKYSQLGWQTVRLHPQTKRPIERLWQNRNNAANEFTPGDNVGTVNGEVSGGFVDIDLDLPESRKAAKLLLPKTGVRFGRRSCPGAHFLYQVDQPGKSERFKASDGRMILEYRANKSLTMMPPSIHPSGETVIFEEFGELGRTTRQLLFLRCCLIAILVEVSRAYRPGNRHDTALALSGMLVRKGFDRETIRSCMEALDDIAG